MNKTNKILLGLGVSTLLTVTLIAGDASHNSCGGKSFFSNFHSSSSEHGYKREHGFKKIIKQLDITDEQKKEIQGILKNNHSDMTNIADAFTASSFDKNKFISIIKDNKYGKIEKKADMISKSYSILTDIQKEKLKKLLDERKTKNN